MLKTGSRFTIDIAFIEVSFSRWNRELSMLIRRTVWGWSDTLRSCLTTPWRCTGTPWSLPLKLILPFNVFPLISGDTPRSQPLLVLISTLLSQYTKRSKRSSTAHTNWHVRRSQIWCWAAAVSQRLFSSQNILRQRSWEEAQGRGATCSEASYDAQWEAKTGRDVPWIFRKVRRDSFVGQGWRGEW